MTEDQAKTKWCPMTRFKMDEVAVNRHNGTPGKIDVQFNPPYARCIASECMMWRWWQIEANNGYCGLAGKP